MKVSVKAEHAIHAMLYVAAMKDKVSSINEIAEQESIPREYLAKILRELVMTGLLKSHRGYFGGYKLAKPANKISFLDIIEAMDGTLRIVSCVDDHHSKAGKPKRKYCTAQVFWVPLQYKLKETLSEMTLDKIKP
jgi:Rrf2 family transcriptional regulator, iron-sulfur cluster assembly transcription factor